MDSFSSTEAIIDFIKNEVSLERPSKNEVDMLQSLWVAIRLENEQERFLVTPEEWSSWEKFRDEVEDALHKAKSPEDVTRALKLLIEGLSARSREGEMDNYYGVHHGKKIFHAKLQ